VCSSLYILTHTPIHTHTPDKKESQTTVQYPPPRMADGHGNLPFSRAEALWQPSQWVIAESVSTRLAVVEDRHNSYVLFFFTIFCCCDKLLVRTVSF
jgi:hypothetical protein